jgi:sulfur dioxygenase
MLFRQLFDQDSSTYTYLLADEASRKAVVIDPVFEQIERDSTLIGELELDLMWVLDTHVHADHVTAAGLLRERFGAKNVLSERSGAVCASRLVKHGDRIEFGDHELEVRETPGHTNGCLSYVYELERRVFTGDALLIRGCGRTDFQQGDAPTLYRSVHDQLFALPDDTLVYPAHDYRGRTVSSIGEERRLNPRLGRDTSLEQFVHIMHELQLPYPRKLEVALPANLECGTARATGAAPASFEHGWAPVALSRVGVPELNAEWLRAHLDDVLVVDVREPDELRGELGHIARARPLPLQALMVAARSLPRDRPLVTVCRSGGRSGQAALQLLEAGFGRVASLAGGMREWNARGYAVEHGTPGAGWVDRQG